MPSFKAKVEVSLKADISDPEGATVLNAVRSLGHDGVSEVRTGKLIELTLEATTPEQARQVVQELCSRLLANPVMEDVEITIA